MGDDRWRFGGTNFIPGVSTEGGLYINKWTPRLEISGPLVKGRAWFHNGFDAFYNVDTVHGLPRGENRTSGLTTSDLTRFQCNVTPGQHPDRQLPVQPGRHQPLRPEHSQPGGDHHQPPPGDCT